MTKAKHHEWTSRVRLLSLLLAGLLWLSVTLERSAELTLSVPVHARYLPAGLRLEGALPETVQVTVSGPRILLCRLPLCGLSCGLDLSGAVAGTASFQPQADSLRLDRELKVVRMYPAALSLTLTRETQLR